MKSASFPVFGPMLSQCWKKESDTLMFAQHWPNICRIVLETAPLTQCFIGRANITTQYGGSSASLLINVN